jgi:predicted negative regulator of RcsB-dependent stress response
MMTTKAKVLITIVLLAVAGVSVYQWRDKLIPTGKQQNSVNPADVQKAIAQTTPGTPAGAGSVADVTKKLLAGTNAVSLVDGSSIPAVT